VKISLILIIKGLINEKLKLIKEITKTTI